MRWESEVMACPGAADAAEARMEGAVRLSHFTQSSATPLRVALELFHPALLLQYALHWAVVDMRVPLASLPRFGSVLAPSLLRLPRWVQRLRVHRGGLTSGQLELRRRYRRQPD